MRKNRLAALLLTLSLALSLAVPAAAYNAGSLVPQRRTYTTAFPDTKGTWCGAAVQTVYEAGLMDGAADGTFNPTGALTYAQIIVITARLHSLLHGKDGTFPPPAAGKAWYSPAAEYLLKEIDGESESGEYLLTDLMYLDEYAGETCSRNEFVWYLAAVLPESALSPINTITSLPDTSDLDVLKFYNAGILTGSDAYGTFQGFDGLNRGQAAAMLSRIVDPSQRVKFTPETLVMSQVVLGLAPETTVLTVDGCQVSAELVTYFLCSNISAMEMEHYWSYYDDYPEYYDAYWADVNFDGSYLEFLKETYGIDADTPILWNTPDKGGLTPAQKVREDTLSDLKWMASLLSHQSEYPLSTVQKAEMNTYMQTAADGLAPYGYSKALGETLLKSMFLQENLTAKFSMNATDLNQYLKDNGYIYGQYAVIFRGDERSYQYADDQSAKAAAEEVRRQIAAHLEDEEYISYLIWKYSDDYSYEPDLLPITELSLENRQALERLGVGQVSSVLTEDQGYLVVLKLDPSKDEDLRLAAAAVPAEAQLQTWADAAKIADATAFNAIDIAKAAAAFEQINI